MGEAVHQAQTQLKPVRPPPVSGFETLKGANARAQQEKQQRDNRLVRTRSTGERGPP